MKASRVSGMVLSGLLVTAVTCLLAAGLAAQVKNETTTTKGNGTMVVEVERGEIVWISGNDLVVQMENKEIRHFMDIPESARITVGGKELGIHDLKPGMKLERTITTVTIPRTVTKVESVTGKVWQVLPPSIVTLTLEDGTNQQFNIPKGQKFIVNGREVDASGLKKGMKISATRIVETPVTTETQLKKVTGTMPSPPPAPPADQPILIVSEPSAPAQGDKPGAVPAAEPPPKE